MRPRSPHRLTQIIPILALLLAMLAPGIAQALPEAPPTVPAAAALRQSVSVSEPTILPSIASLRNAEGDGQFSAVNEAGQIVGRSQTRLENFHAALWENGTVTDLGALGGEDAESAAWDINESGLIVGESEDADGIRRAVVWENGEIAQLRGLSATGSAAAYGVNASGVIVGESFDDASGQDVPVVWENREPRALPAPVGNDTTVWAVLDSGVILGQTENREEETTHGVYWQDGKLKVLTIFNIDTIVTTANQQGQMAGMAQYSDLNRIPQVWTDGKPRRLPAFEGGRVTVNAMNEAGQLVGYAEEKDGDSFWFSAVTWEDGRIRVLEGPEGRESARKEALGINNAGQIVGAYDDDRWTPVLWQDGDQIDLDPERGFSIRDRMVITDNGLVVANAKMDNYDNAGSYQVVTWQVEPGAVAEATGEAEPVAAATGDAATVAATTAPEPAPTDAPVPTATLAAGQAPPAVAVLTTPEPLEPPASLDCNDPGVPYVTNGDVAQSVAVSQRAGIVATIGAHDSRVRLFDIETNTPVLALFARPNSFIERGVIDIAPNGQWLAATNRVGGFSLWEVATGQILGNLSLGEDEEVTTLAFNPTYQLLATTSETEDGPSYLRFWQLPTLASWLSPIVADSGSVKDIAFSPDGARIVTGGRDGAIHIWDVATGAEVHDAISLNGGKTYASVYDIAFSPDGSMLAVSVGSVGIRVLDTNDWSKVSAISHEFTFTTGLVFSPDGAQLVVSGNNDDGVGALQVWDLNRETWSSAQLVFPWTFAISDVAFLNNRDFAATGLKSLDTPPYCASMWRINLDDLPPAD
ncbi:MAG: hypothetical protein QM692_08435 [Thermomicrobiales bacterium]